MFEGFHYATKGVIEASNRIVVVGQFLANSGKVWQKRRDFDFIGLEELGRLLSILDGLLWIVKRAMRIMRINHKIKGFSLLLTPVEELYRVVVVFFWATTISKFALIVSKIPSERGVAGGMRHFSENAREISMFLKVGKNRRDFLGKLVESVAARVVSISPCCNNTAAWCADRNIDMPSKEGVIVCRKSREVGGDFRNSAAMEVKLFMTKIVGSKEDDIERARSLF